MGRAGPPPWVSSIILAAAAAHHTEPCSEPRAPKAQANSFVPGVSKERGFQYVHLFEGVPYWDISSIMFYKFYCCWHSLACSLFTLNLACRSHHLESFFSGQKLHILGPPSYCQCLRETCLILYEPWLSKFSPLVNIGIKDFGFEPKLLGFVLAWKLPATAADLQIIAIWKSNDHKITGSADKMSASAPVATSVLCLVTNGLEQTAGHTTKKGTIIPKYVSSLLKTNSVLLQSRRCFSRYPTHPEVRGDRVQKRFPKKTVQGHQWFRLTLDVDLTRQLIVVRHEVVSHDNASCKARALVPPSLVLWRMPNFPRQKESCLFVWCGKLKNKLF